MPLVVVDNNNTQRWEYERYETAALAAGYAVQLEAFECRDVAEACQVSRLIDNAVEFPRDLQNQLHVQSRRGYDAPAPHSQVARRNEHGVPEEAVARIFERWEPDPRTQAGGAL